MQEDRIREAFSHVRHDMGLLFQEIEEIKRTIGELSTQIEGIQTKQREKASGDLIPTHNVALEAPESKNTLFSSGNGGVPTNKPTDKQTNQHPIVSSQNAQIQAVEGKIDRLERVSEIIESLDELKKEVRIKFKQLTKQEMMIFATIYQLEEQGFVVDYSLLAERLSLSEISMRDYIRKIIKKGVPLLKYKENNKKVRLSVPQDLKKVASLNTILELREL